ncbi:putative integral membrane protein [Babesia bovis T2Bo]|uniref:Membrane protein, putative n=1 Tax=Babesia bovis TaxID=5865 RepID=A7AQ76_BABBO|nr:putative integral membrane protein [Babesia bovis T2Bo]EDO08710.1 putative integral membrane protein [Babesia bovis T2Bo]|eukprot:XP_001612278.1 membrane protein [Babesia bovis T2Bo]
MAILSKKVLICAISIIWYIAAVSGCMLDIFKPVVSPDIIMHSGTYGTNGIYRMFHSYVSMITNVYYNGNLLKNIRLMDCEPRDVFVQTFQNSSICLIVITIMLIGNNDQAVQNYFITDGSGHRKASNRLRSMHIGSKVFLNVDVVSDQLHPFVVREKINDTTNIFSWSINAGKLTEDGIPIHLLKGKSEDYYISPITNVCYDPLDRSGKMTFIISHCTNVLYEPGGESLWLTISYGIQSKALSMTIPPVIDGIFRPDYIFSTSLYFQLLWELSDISNDITIDIDISNIDNVTPDVVILANLKRGLWLYTQYAVAPIRHHTYTTVKQVTAGVQTLYVTQDNEYVTHVEIFDHVKHGWRYVLVHIRNVKPLHEKENRNYTEHKKLYLRYPNREIVAYKDINDIWLEEYMDMLYNIDTRITTCETIDSDEIIDIATNQQQLIEP